MIKSETNVRVRGEVKNEVATSYSVSQCSQIEVIATNKSEIFGFSSIAQELFLTCRKVVPANNFRSRFQQAIDQVASDKTRSTSHKRAFHGARVACRTITMATSLVEVLIRYRDYTRLRESEWGKNFGAKC